VPPVAFSEPDRFRTSAPVLPPLTEIGSSAPAMVTMSFLLPVLIASEGDIAGGAGDGVRAAAGPAGGNGAGGEDDDFARIAERVNAGVERDGEIVLDAEGIRAAAAHEGERAAGHVKVGEFVLRLGVVNQKIRPKVFRRDFGWLKLQPLLPRAQGNPAQP